MYFHSFTKLDVLGMTNNVAVILLYRLREVKHNLDPLVELVASLRNKELLYRKAFVRRCYNLQKAELEVLIHIYVSHIISPS